MKIIKKFTKRGRRVIHGRSESDYMVKRDGDTCYRRIYEDWTQLEKNGSDNVKKWSPVPLVIMVKGEKVPFDRNNLPQEIAE
jgi:hypothetical protein